MKILCLTIISFLVSFSSTSLAKKFFVQIIPINHHLTTVNTTLEGVVEIVDSETFEIRIETSVFFESGEEEVVVYGKKQGYYDLATFFSYDETTLTIAPKRINTNVFSQGKKQELRRQYKVFLPSHLMFMDKDCLD